MALVYQKFCLVCNKETAWIKSDMAVDKPQDRCRECGKDVWDWAKHPTNITVQMNRGKAWDKAKEAKRKKRKEQKMTKRSKEAQAKLAAAKEVLPQSIYDKFLDPNSYRDPFWFQHQETKRLQEAAQPKTGYHAVEIKKGLLGQASKIQEELDELVDAESQNNPILALCELADLYGAIEAYLKAKSPYVTMDDLKVMAAATQRAFALGHRK